MHRHHRATTAALTPVLLMSAGVAGCGGSSPDPQPSPTPTSSASASASPSRTAPAMPDAATKHTKAGALAFVRHYVDLLNYATFTGDVKELATTGTSKCNSCQNVVRNIQGIYAHGGHVRGGAWRIKFLEARRQQDPDHKLVEAAVRFSPQTIYRDVGTKKRHYPGGNQVFNFYLVYRSGWHITESTVAS